MTYGSNYKHRSYKAFKWHVKKSQSLVNNYQRQTRQRAFISHTPGGSSRYKPPAPSCHGKQAPTSSINRTLIPNYRHPSEKTTATKTPDSSVGCRAFQPSIEDAGCLRRSLIRAGGSGGQPRHHANYLGRVSSVSRAPIKPPGTADRDGLSPERCQYASE